MWKQLTYSRIIRRPVRATPYNSDIKDICIHTLFSTGGKGWSTTGEISENGAAKEIQSFPSDGAALPRETGNENAALCPQHQAAHTQTCTEKIHWLHDTERKPACSKNTAGLEPVFAVHLRGCSILGSLDVNAPQRNVKSKLSLVCSFGIRVRIYVATAFCYPKWQAGWGLFLLTSPSLLSWGFSGMQDEMPLHYGPGLRYVRELNLSQHLKAFGEKSLLLSSAMLGLYADISFILTPPLSQWISADSTPCH